MADLINSGNKKDKWTKRVTDLLNWLNAKKQATLVAGENVTLTPQQDGTVQIDVGESGKVDDVLMNGNSIVQNKVASFNNYVELTQAEYDALPDSKYSDNILYAIKDAGIGIADDRYSVCDLIFENTDWSIASGTGDVSHTYTLDKPIDDYDAILVTGFMFNSSNENERNQIQTMYITRNDYYLRSKTGSIYTAFALQGTVVGVRRRIYFGFENATKLCVIDTRSQSGEEPKIYKIWGIRFGGSLTKQHVYSTEEHIIGTWLDGKILYEKSGIIPYSAFTTEGVQKVVNIASQLGLSNIDIKYYEGELRSSIYGRSLLGARTYNTNQSVSQDLSNWYGESSFYYGQVALRMYNDATTLFDRWAPDLQITVRYTKNT